MLRDEWEFEYTARDLADAAEKQKEFREARVKAWETKKEEVMGGLSVHESPSDLMKYTSNNNYNTVGRGPQILIDTTMQQDLNECVEKINTHRGLAKQYEGWVQVLRANPESRIKLHHDDWLFFFGK